jgi:hypothetical protein
MNRDDIIRMAREAGWSEIGADLWGATNDGAMSIYALERFFKLAYEAGAAAEREACARLVEPSDEHRRDASWAYLGGEEGVEMLDGIAAAIRARSKE